MRIRIIAALASAAIVLAACGGGSTTAAAPSTAGSQTPAQTPITPKPHSPKPSPVPVESPVPAESNPPGDIPDSTQFVPYASHGGGFKISVPEGWARTTDHSSVTFTDKLNTVVVTWQPASSAPSVTSATSTEVPQLRKTTRAFRLKNVSSVSLPAGLAVLIEYQANSDPNPVTGKQYRLDVLRYELFHNGTQEAITLLSPVGADNVDPWRIVTQSFSWM